MMKKFLTSFILVFTGLWFVKLWYAGQLDFYILPRFNVLVLATALFLFGLGVALLMIKANWHHALYHIENKSMIPFFGIVLIVALIAPQPLSSQSVMKRGFDTDLSNIKLTTPVNFSVDSSKRTFADWIKIIGANENPRQYAGEPVRVKGFVYRDETSADDEFFLSRFLIRCCSADARPVVLRVKSDQATSLENDQWLEVVGVFGADEDPDQPLFIKVQETTEIPIPDTPYIY